MSTEWRSRASVSYSNVSHTIQRLLVMQLRKTEAVSVRKTCVYARKHASTSSRSNFSQRSTRRWRKKRRGKYTWTAAKKARREASSRSNASRKQISERKSKRVRKLGGSCAEVQLHRCGIRAYLGMRNAKTSGRQLHAIDAA